MTGSCFLALFLFGASSQLLVQRLNLRVAKTLT